MKIPREKLLRMVAEFLRSYSNELGNNVCNDWDFPEDWTEEERVALVKEYHDRNGDPEEFDPDCLLLSDMCATWILAEILDEEADEEEERVDISSTVNRKDPPSSRQWVTNPNGL